MVGITQKAVLPHFRCGLFKKEWLGKVTGKHLEGYYRGF